jgi:chemotaxis protein MotB
MMQLAMRDRQKQFRSGFRSVEPMFPDNPYLAANRRVAITLLHEAPPVAPDLKP